MAAVVAAIVPAQSTSPRDQVAHRYAANTHRKRRIEAKTDSRPKQVRHVANHQPSSYAASYGRPKHDVAKSHAMTAFAAAYAPSGRSQHGADDDTNAESSGTCPDPIEPIQMARASLQASQIRVLAQSRFCHAFFPKHRVTAGAALFTCPGADIEPTVTASDAYCLLLLGDERKDARMLRAAYTLYGRALARLRLELERADVSQSLDHITSALVYLTTFELQNGPTYDSPAWLQHAEGLFSFFRVRD
jgi:hypothetical protein